MSEPGIGHNSGEVLSKTAQERLNNFVERIENLNEDAEEIAADLKEVYTEAKGEGFDTKILRKVIKIRALERSKYEEEQSLIELYLSAIGYGAVL